MTLRDKYMREKLYQAQNGRCNAPCEDYRQDLGISLPIRLMHCDHIDCKGPDGIENRQLLCSHCNQVKGDRDMAFLLEYHRMGWEMEQMRQSQLTLIPQERIAKRRRHAVTRKQQSQPQYMNVACMAGVLFAASRHLGI